MFMCVSVWTGTVLGLNAFVLPLCIKRVKRINGKAGACANVENLFFFCIFKKKERKEKREMLHNPYTAI